MDSLRSRFQPAVLLRVTARKSQALTDRAKRLDTALPRQIRQARSEFRRSDARLSPRPLVRKLDQDRDCMVRVLSGLDRAARQQNAHWRDRLDGLERMRQTLGYRETLARGYAVVRGDQGQVLTNEAQARAADLLIVEFRDGQVQALPTDNPPKSAPKSVPKAAAKPTSGGSGDDQGTLF